MTTNGMATNWECFCGNFIADAFVCDKCGLSAICSDMKKNPDVDQMMRGMIEDIGKMDWSIKDKINKGDENV